MVNFEKEKSSLGKERQLSASPNGAGLRVSCIEVSTCDVGQMVSTESWFLGPV